MRPTKQQWSISPTQDSHNITGICPLSNHHLRTSARGGESAAPRCLLQHLEVLVRQKDWIGSPSSRCLRVLREVYESVQIHPVPVFRSRTEPAIDIRVERLGLNRNTIAGRESWPMGVYRRDSTRMRWSGPARRC
jgi:hypothetical protein